MRGLKHSVWGLIDPKHHYVGQHTVHFLYLWTKLVHFLFKPSLSRYFHFYTYSSCVCATSNKEEVKTKSEWNKMAEENIFSIISYFWIGCVLIISVLDFFLTMTSKLTLPLATAAWCRVWFLEVSVSSALLASSHDSLDDLITPWSFCCRTGGYWYISAEDRIWSGFSSSRRLGSLLNIFLLCTASRCCVSGWICSGSGLLSSGGGSSTETRLATREDGSTVVTTRVTRRGKGALGNTKTD